MLFLKTTLRCAAAAAALAAFAVTGAHAFPKKVNDACAGDYQDFCSQYLPESTQAHRCFESNARSLSKSCVRALVDAGMVPAKYLRK